VAVAIAIGTSGGVRDVAVRAEVQPRDHAAQPAPLPPPASRAAVRAVGAARFVRVQAPPDEIIRLDEGTIVLEVVSLPRGERFRVQTDDGVVEVRGTRFEVSASQRKLVAVSVSKGRVEVRSEAGALAVLDPGDEWVHNPTPAPPPAEVAPATPSSSHVSPKLPASASATREQATRAAKMSFDRAWSLLRLGHARDAAALFAEVERVARDAGTREDALYWRAVATARTGDAAEAKRLFVDLLKRFPRASRSGQAATALGWLLLDSGDTAAAAGAFERAINDQSPAIRASAAEGLRRATAR
jgi:TolA-binding protein